MAKATLNQAQEILKLVAHQPIDCERLQKLLESGLLSDLLIADPASVDRDAFRAALALTFKVIVDYTKPLADMIVDGKYDDVNLDITAEHFPIDTRHQSSADDVARASEEIKIRLVHLGRDAKTAEVEAEFDKTGLRPVTLPELLALYAAYPDLQRKYQTEPIVALGSVWRMPEDDLRKFEKNAIISFCRYPDCDLCVPMLDEYNKGRRLILRWCGPMFGWGSHHRFAAVRK